MKRKLSEEERRLHRYNSVLNYRRTEKGRIATRGAALRYYHRNKVLKKKYPKIECIEVTFSESKEKGVRSKSS